uniref:Syntaxin N-terminal domain-containing protein n=1 Tax=Glossina austeni TaxID=7395 RepID=A0A1A9VSL8_GLOAU
MICLVFLTPMPPLIIEINSHVALFRDMLILVGQPRDCPELREKIRKLRRTCVETSKHMAHLIMTQLKRRHVTRTTEVKKSISGVKAAKNSAAVGGVVLMKNSGTSIE